MKARTVAAAIAIAVATPATATAQIELSEENRAKLTVCLQDAVKTKTGLETEEISDIVDGYVIANFDAHPEVLEMVEIFADIGLLEPEKCPGDFGRKMIEGWDKDEWIRRAKIVRRMREIQRRLDAKNAESSEESN